ncbi:MAG: ArsR family transcriptional regulator, partial [Thermoplasmata archaeon]|nr:ArsR family transcriptional regulator [Thermoplasmata archaeon]
PDLEMNARLVYQSDILNSGNSIPLILEVYDKYDVPIKDALVIIMSYPNEEFYATAITDVNGRISVEFRAFSDVEVNYDLVITVMKEGYEDVETYFMITVFPVQEANLNGGVPIAIGAMMVATFLSTEAGKYGMFKVVMFPLYTRLKKDEVLDHFVRGQIFGYIMSHPGESYNSIKSDLKITNGTLSHHLRTLEVQGFIKSSRTGVNTRFYPIDMKIPQEKGIRLSDLQMRIVEMIKKRECLTQTEIAENLEVSQQCISYNLRLMGREGIIGIERFGRERKYYLMST